MRQIEFSGKTDKPFSAQHTAKGDSLLADRKNGHVERLIGSIRRESLDHLIVFDEAQLRRVLKKYASYYKQVRTHLSLDKGHAACETLG